MPCFHSMTPGKTPGGSQRREPRPAHHFRPPSKVYTRHRMEQGIFIVPYHPMPSTFWRYAPCNPNLRMDIQILQIQKIPVGKTSGSIQIVCAHKEKGEDRETCLPAPRKGELGMDLSAAISRRNIFAEALPENLKGITRQPPLALRDTASKVSFLHPKVKRYALHIF